MNERILELYEQSLLHKTGHDYNGNPLYEIRQNPKLFAELIVRECAEQIKTHGIGASREDYGDYEIGFNAGLFHALRTTIEHFGVE